MNFSFRKRTVAAAHGAAAQNQESILSRMQGGSVQFGMQLRPMVNIVLNPPTYVRKLPPETLTLKIMRDGGGEGEKIFTSEKLV